MRVKVISHGSWRNTTVVDATTGEPIEGVTEVRIRTKMGELTTVQLTVEGAEVDMVGEYDEEDDAP